MSYEKGNIVHIKRSNGAISLAKIIDTPVHWVKDRTNGTINEISKIPSDKPVGARAKDKDAKHTYTSTLVYRVQILKDDLTPTEQGKLITKFEIVESMTPQRINYSELKNELPIEIQMKIDEHAIDALEIRDVDNITDNLKLLKLYMHKYKTIPRLLAKIKEKLNSMMLQNNGFFHNFHGGAHPEWIMNTFIYNPRKNRYFKLLRIDGNQVTVQMQHKSDPIRMGLDEFLRTEINDRTVHQMRTEAMIGEIYRILPEYNEYDLDERGIYLAHLMEVFEKKPSGEPSSEFFSVPIEEPVPASSFPASAASSVRASAARSFFPAADITPKHPLFPTSLQKPLRIMKTAMDELVQKPPKLRNVSSHDGGSRKNMKSTRKQRMYKKSRKSRKSRKH